MFPAAGTPDPASWLAWPPSFSVRNARWKGSLHRELQSRAGWLALCNLSPDLYRILEATRLTGLLRVYRGQEEVA